MVNTVELRKARCSKGYFTSKGFAKELGLSYSSYRNRENGKVRFTASEIVKICELLGITLEEGMSILM